LLQEPKNESFKTRLLGTIASFVLGVLGSQARGADADGFDELCLNMHIGARKDG